MHIGFAGQNPTVIRYQGVCPLEAIVGSFKIAKRCPGECISRKPGRPYIDVISADIRLSLERLQVVQETESGRSNVAGEIANARIDRLAFDGMSQYPS